MNKSVRYEGAHRLNIGEAAGLPSYASAGAGAYMRAASRPNTPCNLPTGTPGQKIAYVTAAADTAANRKAITRLIQNADLLFIEAAFAEADVALAAERAHLTTAAAGRIAREAGVRHVEPFHFSPRYGGEETRMLNEVRPASPGDLPRRRAEPDFAWLWM